MVIDTSALLAILFDEPERSRFIDLIDADDVRLVSVMSWVEAAFVVIGRKGGAGFADLDHFFTTAQINRVPVAIDHAELAVDAFRDFGKGRHPAALNIGDCFTYALAKATGERLLFKGADFRQTDIVPVA